MVQEHHINVFEQPLLVQPHERRIARADFDLDDIAQSCEVYERADDGTKLRVSLQTEVLLASSLLDCIAE